MPPKRDPTLAFRADVLNDAWQWAEHLLGEHAPQAQIRELVMKIVRATYKTLPDDAKKRYQRGWSVPAEMRCVPLTLTPKVSKSLGIDPAATGHAPGADVLNATVVEAAAEDANVDAVVEHVAPLVGPGVQETDMGDEVGPVVECGLCGFDLMVDFETAGLGDGQDLVDPPVACGNDCLHAFPQVQQDLASGSLDERPVDEQGALFAFMALDDDLFAEPSDTLAPLENAPSGRPKRQHYIDACHAYERIHRSRLNAAVKDEQPTLKGAKFKRAVRRKAEKELRKCDPAAQWAYAMHPRLDKNAVHRDGNGRFVPAFRGDLSELPAPIVEGRQAPKRTAAVPYTSLPRFDGRRRRRRQQTLRQSIISSASGPWQEDAAPGDVAAVLADTLSVHEMLELAATNKFQKAVGHSHTTNAWAKLGETIVEVFKHEYGQNLRKKENANVMAGLAVAARTAGLSSKVLESHLGLKFGRKTWKRSRTCRAPALATKRSNGRLGWRKMNPLEFRKVLLNHSQSISSLLKGRKRKRVEGEPPPEPKTRYQRLASMPQIWADEQLDIKLRTAQRYAKEQPEVEDIRQNKKALDICDKCLSWDKTVRPQITTWTKEVRAKLNEAWPTY